MSKHTPGPWRVGNTDPLLFGRPHGNGSEPIGFVYGPSFAEGSEVGQRAMADARLCAAAPELLAHLEFAVALLGAMPVLSGTAQVEAMRAAIVKATGNQE